jgi:Cu2+-exporting ATPase
VILGVAVLSAVVWWLQTHDALQTGAVVTAVLVVSCPCAIGLAFPLADELAAVALRRRGVFVREADLWPRLGRIRRIVFDKTGTLTLETPRLRNPEALAALPAPARAALLALVRDSLHPVSQSLLENLLAAGVPAPLPEGDLTDEPGFGVRLETGTSTWTLGRAGWAGSDPAGQATEFACDGVVLARFAFADEIRSGAREEIAALQAQGFAVHILSGDHPAKVAAMAVALDLPASHAVGGATPRQKADWIHAHDQRDTLMLGDGANDSLAFAAAFARGTPVVHRGVLESRADFYYLGRGLDGLGRMFVVNAARRRTQAWLLAFSVSYNALAIGLAVTGHMQPLVAAILMPVSSLVSLAIVAGGMRLVLVHK